MTTYKIYTIFLLHEILRKKNRSSTTRYHRNEMNFYSRAIAFLMRVPLRLTATRGRIAFPKFDLDY